MELTINGTSVRVYSFKNLTGLLTLYTQGKTRVAVELNGEIIPRSQHTETPINNGDNIEIIHAIGGG
ncbi:MAG: sulfur carrier protein ThiS [Motiliproteus sp.]